MLVAHVRDLGLIVFSACSHAGIVNVCIHARDLFPDIPIYCVMGGLHLGGIMERIIPETVDGLRPFRINHISPVIAPVGGRCTRSPMRLVTRSVSPRWARNIRLMPATISRLKGARQVRRR